MRRPVKYNTRQAAKNRLIAGIAASVLGVGVIGGAAAAILLNREDDVIDGIGTGSDSMTPVISDTVGDTAATDTDIGTEPTETEPVSETVTEPLTETEPCRGVPPLIMNFSNCKPSFVLFFLYTQNKN